MNCSSYTFALGACVIIVACSDGNERDAARVDSRFDAGEIADAEADAGVADTGIEDSGVAEDLAQRFRDLFGLNAGSCYRFRSSVSGQAEIVADGIWIYTRGETTGEEALVVSDTGVRLGRSSRLAPEGPNRTGPEIRFNDDGPSLLITSVWPPDLAEPKQFDSTASGSDVEVTIRPGNVRSETGNLFPSRAYQSTVSAIEAARHDGTRSPAIRIDVSEESLPFWSADLIPAYGPARFIDRQGVVHDVCDARVCDRDRACTGATDCAQLACP